MFAPGWLGQVAGPTDLVGAEEHVVVGVVEEACGVVGGRDVDFAVVGTEVGEDVGGGKKGWDWEELSLRKLAQGGC